MNWDAIAAVSEAIGAAGVIASLLYLAIQVRASTRASAVESKLAGTRMYTDFLSMIVKEPELNELMLRGRKDLQTLSKDEYLRFSNLALIAFSFFSAAWFQYRHKTISDSDWYELNAITKYWLIGKGTQEWWYKLGTLSFDKPFSDYIESEIQLANRGGKVDE